MKTNSAKMKRVIGTLTLSAAMVLIGTAGATTASAQMSSNPDCSKYAYAGSRMCSTPTTTAASSNGGGMSLSGGRVDGGGTTGSGHLTADNGGGETLGSGGRSSSSSSGGFLSTVWNWLGSII